MSTMIRIGSLYFDLARCRVDLDYPNYVGFGEGRHKIPTIRIYFSAELTGADGLYGPEYINYTGAAYDAIKERLQNVLANMCVAQIDLPAYAPVAEPD